MVPMNKKVGPYPTFFWWVWIKSLGPTQTFWINIKFEGRDGKKGSSIDLHEDPTLVATENPAVIPENLGCPTPSPGPQKVREGIVYLSGIPPDGFREFFRTESVLVFCSNPTVMTSWWLAVALWCEHLQPKNTTKGSQQKHHLSTGSS